MYLPYISQVDYRQINGLGRLMVLCPFVYLMLRHDIPPLSLQPTEVPIRGLLSPVLRSSERADVSDRLKQQRGPLMKVLIRAATGQLIFTSTVLIPSESLYCTSAPGFIPVSTPGKSTSYLSESLGLGSVIWQNVPSRAEGPYLLWGLTLGIVTDLLHQIETQATSTLWSWPTFSHWDIRAILWIITNRLRKNEKREVNQREIVNRSKDTVPKINSIDDTSFAVSGWQPSLAAARLPDEYFRFMRRAIIFAFILRVNAFAVFVAVLIARY